MVGFRDFGHGIEKEVRVSNQHGGLRRERRAGVSDYVSCVYEFIGFFLVRLIKY